MKVLFITSYLPYADVAHAGGKVTYNNIKNLMSKGHEVSVISFVSNELEKMSLKKLSQEKFQLDYVCISKKEKVFNALKNFYIPNLVAVKYTVKMKNLIRDKMSKTKYDVVYCDFTALGIYSTFIKKIDNNCRVIWIEHDVSFLAYKRKYKEATNIIKRCYFYGEYKRMKRFELKFCNHFEEIVVLNQKDKKLLEKHDIKNIKVILPYFEKYEILKNNEKKEINLFFWGAMHRVENQDAVEVFCEKIWKDIKNKYDNLYFYVIGANPNKQFMNKVKDDKIIFTGFVENPASIFSNMDIAIFPLRLGAGIKIKVLECMYAGIPVATTEVGIEGINATSGKDYILVNEENMVEQIINLINDKKLRRQIGDNSKLLMQQLLSEGEEL